MNKSKVRYHVGTVLVMIGFVITLLVLIGFTSNAAAEATPGHKAPHKDYVCKYVGTPGVGERLQTGQNPIWVDSHATQGTWLNDKHGRSYVLIANTPRLDPEPSVDQCPQPVDPTTTTSSTTTTPSSSSSTSSTTTSSTSATSTTTGATTPPVTTTSSSIPPVTFSPPQFIPPVNVTTTPPATVTAPTTPPLRPLSPPIDTLPYTGSSTLPLLAMAGGLILLGLVLRLGNRVRLVRSR